MARQSREHLWRGRQRDVTMAPDVRVPWWCFTAGKMAQCAFILWDTVFVVNILLSVSCKAELLNIIKFLCYFNM